MFCSGPLGQNHVLETFPIGRRLAFDAVRGRLWVVCRKCERWNLSPIEERWEAVEDLEKLFRDARIRTSSENVGLAKHPEGLEMVRIGTPLRQEFAAWRYGDQFGRRRKRAILYSGAGIAAIGVVVVGGLATGVVSAALLGQSGNLVSLFMNGRTLVTIKAPDGSVLKLKRPDLQKTEILRDGDRWLLQVHKKKKDFLFEGEEARRVAGILSSRLNHSGAKKADVQTAVGLIDELGSTEAIMRAAAESVVGKGRRRRVGRMARLDAPLRLAVEMALHEEQERRALEGELWILERAWEEAEEIAGISDSLLLPEGAADFVGKHRDDAGQPD